ncbi:MAG: hypothetical protein AVDCRST_MAG42-377 [uncultured Chthoniobacterales bacterium]|uniref:HTH luxR-type domain-containing protein n=1 Tax=uncultured Chthoniobacterales bacterium TaxID=1836801 RepID=A0A6J4H7U5_9BACT|nr:MAG: hypothetical protein AVDCRST_MAG42-377 [uncultured Chthoniobacterales bacterium]
MLESADAIPRPRRRTAPGLSEDDYRRVLDTVPELYRGLGLTTYPRASLRALDGLVPSLFATYRELELRSKTARYVCEPEKYAGGLEQSAPPTSVTPLGNLGNLRARTAREILSFTVSPSASLKISFTLHRPDGEFTDRDRAIASLLRPHLANAYLLAVAVTQRRGVELLSGRQPESSGDHGLLVVDRSCRIVHSNRRAVSQLRHGFPSTAGERLPPEISRWLTTARSYAGTDPLDLEITGAELPLAVRAAAAEGGHWLLVLTEMNPALMPSLLQKRFRLTARQAELLYWLSKGRSNREMGIIFSISARTVDKHLQHVFEKLDVENRHAAVVKALEALSAR